MSPESVGDEPSLGAGFVDRGILIKDGFVRRPRGYWTPAVHDLLAWLAGTGFGLAPVPRGFNEEFEVVSYLEGEDQGWPLMPLIQGVEGALAAGRLAQQLESILKTYSAQPDAIWQGSEDPHASWPMAHGDLGPWNMLWDTHRRGVCGVIDWDLAGPAPAGYDAGFLAWFIVPILDDERARVRGFDRSPARWARLEAYCEGYGASMDDVMAMVFGAQDEFRRRIEAGSESGSETYRMLKERGLIREICRDGEFGRSWYSSRTTAEAGE